MPNLKDLKHFFIRLFYKCTHPFRKLHWFLFRPRRTGVKCVISHNGEILLVRLTYAHKKWTVPGGRVGKGETHEEAAKRETFEEVGINLDRIKQIGSFFNDLEYKRDTIHCFYSEVSDRRFNVDGLEIGEAAWFSPEALPHDMGRQARRVVSMYIEHRKTQ